MPIHPPRRTRHRPGSTSGTDICELPAEWLSEGEAVRSYGIWIWDMLVWILQKSQEEGQLCSRRPEEGTTGFSRSGHCVLYQYFSSRKVIRYHGRYLLVHCAIDTVAATEDPQLSWSKGQRRIALVRMPTECPCRVRPATWKHLFECPAPTGQGGQCRAAYATPGISSAFLDIPHSDFPVQVVSWPEAVSIMKYLRE